jgi:hypothetical protein
MRTTYVMYNGELIDKRERPEPVVKRGAVPTPMIIAGMEPYISPVDGRVIRNAQERRDDLKRNDCIPWEPGINQDANKKARFGGRTPGRSRKAPKE